MKKFYEINLKYFSDHLKEVEFKYNTQEDERLAILLALRKSYEKNPLHVSQKSY